MKKATTIQFNKFNFLIGFLKGSLGLLFIIAGGVLCSVTQWSGLGLLAGVSLSVFGCIQFLDGIKDLRDGISSEEVMPVTPKKSTHQTHRRSNSHSLVYKHHHNHKHHQHHSTYMIEQTSGSDNQRPKNNKIVENIAEEQKWYSGIMTFFCSNKQTPSVVIHSIENHKPDVSYNVSQKAS